MRKLVQNNETKKVLTTRTKNIILVMYSLFLGLLNKGSTFGQMTNLAKTLGLTESCLCAIFKEFVPRDFETERK